MIFSTSDYGSFVEKAISGRYLTRAHIAPLLKNLKVVFKITSIGKSVLGKPIESIEIGDGPIKVLMWSQMHGNEATTTKAVFDLLNFLNSESELAKDIGARCRILIIPMLNPDGAVAYTRANANGLDLNRDARHLSQPESKVLRSVYNRFEPEYCFNLHDQRTMYNVGDSELPATVSFLAPSMDVQRSISPARKKSMQLIVAINKGLQKVIPGQIGRYDDGFNSNCVGDSFQMLGTPTVLFEAGHYPNDFDRERTREFIGIALITALQSIKNNDVGTYSEEEYFKIPENGKRFFDILIRNAHYIDSAYDTGVHLGIRFEEKLTNGRIHFEAKVESAFGDNEYLGHQTYDCSESADVIKLQNRSFYSTLFD